MKGNAYVPFMLRRGDGSTLSLDFTAMGDTLDSRFTFTRSSTTSTYINSSGFVATAGTNVPRFDYNPTTLTARGLLIEAAGINIALRSQALNTLPWFNAGTMTVTENGSGSPANDATSNRITWTNGTGAGSSWLQQNVAVSAGSLVVGTAYTWSVWMKSRGNRKVNVFAVLQGVTGNREMRVDFSVSPPTVTSISATGWISIQAPTIVEYPNGWYKLITGGTLPSGTTSVNFGFSNSDAVPASGTNGFEAWGYQVEAGSGEASSYIPTVGSTVQRTADTCIASSTGFSSWFTGGTTGTFYADWFGGVRGITSTVRTVLSTSDVTGRHLHLQQTAAAGNLKVADFGAANSVTTSNSITSGARTKGAFSFSGSTVNLTLNGGTVATSSSIAFSTAPTWLVLGGVSTNGTTITDATVLLNGSIRAIKYWPSVLPTATLQSLTA